MNYTQLRSDFGNNIFQIQQHFMSIINRPDDKAVLLMLFREKYSTFKRTTTNF